MGIQLLGLRPQMFESGIWTAVQPLDHTCVELDTKVGLAGVSRELITWIGLDAESMWVDRKGNNQHEWSIVIRTPNSPIPIAGVTTTNT